MILMCSRVSCFIYFRWSVFWIDEWCSGFVLWVRETIEKILRLQIFWEMSAWRLSALLVLWW